MPGFLYAGPLNGAQSKYRRSGPSRRFRGPNSFRSGGALLICLPHTWSGLLNQTRVAAGASPAATAMRRNGRVAAHPVPRI